MHNIGSVSEAEVILSWVRSSDEVYGRPGCAMREEAPEGWEFLGRGSFRSVWRSPSGIAYKVNHDDHDQQSRDEADNLREAWKRGVPDGCRLPEFNLLEIGEEVVVAVEVINGSTLYEYSSEGNGAGHLYDLLRKVENMFLLGDLHDENAMVDEDGLLVVVDFGG